MKITKIIEETKSISSNIKNAYIDFSKMTISLVAVVSDVIKTITYNRFPIFNNVRHNGN